MLAKILLKTMVTDAIADVRIQTNTYVSVLMVSMCNSLPWHFYLIKNCQVLLSYKDLEMANSKTRLYCR